MSPQDIYTDTNETNLFQDIDWGQSLDNTLYEDPSLYTTQLYSSPDFLTAPTYQSDLIQYYNFAFGDPQRETPNDFLKNSFTFECSTN